MDPDFHRSFSEALAKALIENEEEQEQNEANEQRRSDELARATFEQLHFDQPVGLSALGCRILSQALINPRQSQYCLSGRLVNGLRQAHDRHHHEPRARGQPAAQDDEGGDDAPGKGNEPLVRPSADDSPEDLAAGLALLSWTICGRIPLRILCYEDPPEALLGSYRGGTSPPNRIHDGHDGPSALRGILEQPLRHNGEPLQEPPSHGGDDDEDNDSTHSGASAPPQERHLNGSTPHPIDADDDEVWADESDPSDYDYCGDSAVQPDELGRLEDLDPALWLCVSPQPEPLSNLEVAQALVSLLSDLSFHSLVALSWTTKVEEELTQLALVLLLARHHHHGSSILACIEESVWQQLALRPVHVLRDAAAYHPDRLPAYLQLLQSMIQVHDLPKRSATREVTSQLCSSSGCQNESSSLPPATWIALTLLSSLCATTHASACSQPHLRHNIQRRVDLLQKSLVECMDPLVDILDIIEVAAGAISSRSQGAEHDLKDEILPTLLAPVFHSLSLPVSPQTNQTQAYQLLLNSGLFRQWLVLWQVQHRLYLQAAEIDKQKALKANLECIESSLLDLCATSPMLIGKYTWRFPGFAAAVTKPQTSCYPLEWNVLGMDISAGSSPPKMQWKSSSVAMVEPPPSTAVCQAASRTLFRLRLESVRALIAEWKEERQCGESISRDEDAVERFHRDHRVLVEFELFVNRLVRCSLLRETVLRLDGSGASDGGEHWSLRESFVPLQQLLATWPNQQRSTSVENRLKVKLDDAHEPPAPAPAGAGAEAGSRAATTIGSTSSGTVQPPQWKRSAQDAAVDTLRRSMKTLQSLVDESRSDSAGHTPMSRRIPAFSSKAD